MAGKASLGMGTTIQALSLPSAHLAWADAVCSCVLWAGYTSASEQLAVVGPFHGRKTVSEMGHSGPGMNQSGILKCK